MENNLNNIKGLEQYEGYTITDEGKIISYKGKVPKELVLQKDQKGYLFVRLRYNSPKIHRLVAISFIENPEDKPQVNHIDGDKENNHVSNLEWVTNQENMTHAWKLGLQNNKHAEKENNYQWDGDHTNCKKVVQKDLEGNELNTYKSIAIASRDTGYERSGISKTCNNKQSKFKGYKWEFID